MGYIYLYSFPFISFNASYFSLLINYHNFDNDLNIHLSLIFSLCRLHVFSLNFFGESNLFLACILI